MKEKSRQEIHRLLSLLDMKNGAVNLDFIVDSQGEVYIIEIGPRNGGNLITDIIKEASGVDLAKYTIMTALGMDCTDLKEKPIHTYVSSYVIHSLEDGVFDDIWISEDIIRFDLFVSKGEQVYRFDNGGLGVGAMLIKYSSTEQMIWCMDHMEEFIKVKIKEARNT